MVRAMPEGEKAMATASRTVSIPMSQKKNPQSAVTAVLSMRQRALAYKGGGQQTLQLLSGGNHSYCCIDYLEEHEVRWLQCRLIVPGPPGFLCHARSR